MRFESVRQTFNEHMIGTVIGKKDAEMLRRGFLEIALFHLIVIVILLAFSYKQVSFFRVSGPLFWSRFWKSVSLHFFPFVSIVNGL